MRVAVASQDYATVTGHAGQARRWLLFEVAPERPPTEIARVELAKMQVFHHWDDQGPHPLDGIAAVITTSAGDSFVARMAGRDVTTVITGEGDPVKAVADWHAGTVVAPKPRPLGRLLCQVHDLFSKHRRRSP